MTDLAEAVSRIGQERANHIAIDSSDANFLNGLWHHRPGRIRQKGAGFFCPRTLHAQACEGVCPLRAFDVSAFALARRKATTLGSIITQQADRVHLTSVSLATFRQTYRPPASELSR
jgi:hypothetical protein